MRLKRLTGWRKARGVVVASIALFIVVQTSIPISRLDSIGLGERFAWQMFSAYQPTPEFTVHTDEGSRPIDLAEITVGLRADLDLDSVVPPFLCEHVEGAIAVSWEQATQQC